MGNYSTIEGMIRQSTDNPIKPALYIKFKATHDDAVLPAANNKEFGTGDTGFDLVAVEDVDIPHGKSVVVSVGLTLADISPGYWIRIEPRSGLGFKHSLQPHLGVIDNGYRGDLAVKMYNFHDEVDYVVSKGDKIAQLVMYELLQPKCEWATEITETARGDKGFGSSDTKPYVTTQEADDWYYANTYKVDEGASEHAKFDTVEDFMKYAKETNMPDDIFGEWLAVGVWKRK
jgi:dUTP pyrophosphatase